MRIAIVDDRPGVLAAVAVPVLLLWCILGGWMCWKMGLVLLTVENACGDSFQIQTKGRSRCGSAPLS